jgi:hypothetical protein
MDDLGQGAISCERQLPQSVEPDIRQGSPLLLRTDGPMMLWKRTDGGSARVARVIYGESRRFLLSQPVPAWSIRRSGPTVSNKKPYARLAFLRDLNRADILIAGPQIR